jgi:undecaprenyl-diphosphatase
MPNFSAASLKEPALKLIRLLKRASMVEKSALFIIGLSAAALYAFGSLADEVTDGDTRAFDEFVLLAFRNQADLSDPLGPEWLGEMMRDFTALGSIAVLVSITLAVAGYLALVQKRRVAMMVAGGVASGMLLSSLLKWGFSRSRPELVPHISEVYTQSFPSGHAMLSAIVYLTLGILLARTQAEPRVKVYLLSVAAAATFIVGISRVYLGVHWPTDVLAGWTIGAGWALLCWLVMLWLQGHGKVEPETESNADIPPTGMTQ